MNGHEESMERLRVIAHHAGCSDRVYYFRVKARLDTGGFVSRDKAWCSMK